MMGQDFLPSEGDSSHVFHPLIIKSEEKSLTLWFPANSSGSAGFYVTWSLTIEDRATFHILQCKNIIRSCIYILHDYWESSLGYKKKSGRGLVYQRCIITICLRFGKQVCVLTQRQDGQQ